MIPYSQRLQNLTSSTLSLKYVCPVCHCQYGPPVKRAGQRCNDEGWCQGIVVSSTAYFKGVQV